MREKDDTIYLNHILDAILKIEKYIHEHEVETIVRDIPAGR